MKTIRLSICLAILMIVIPPLLFSQDLEDKIARLYEGKTVVWEKELQKPYDIAVAQESHDFVVCQAYPETGTATVEYYRADGTLAWQLDESAQSHIQDVGRVSAIISDNGASVLLNWVGDYESATYQIYDSTGSKLFDPHGDSWGGMWELSFHFSPNGKYHNWTNGIYTIEGEKIPVEFPVSYSEIRVRFNFLNNHTVVGKVVGWEPLPPANTLEEMKKRRGQKAPREYYWFVYDFEQKTVLAKSKPQRNRYSIVRLENYFLVYNHRTKQKSLYNRAGVLQWARRDFFQSEYLYMT